MSAVPIHWHKSDSPLSAQKPTLTIVRQFDSIQLNIDLVEQRTQFDNQPADIGITYIGPDLLRRGIANRLQERVHGSLTGVTKREIARLQKRVERTGKAGPTHAISLKNGTRLVREWNSKSYHALVCDEGFEFEGRQFTSLSHIAREITNAHWSSPRFFGLKKRSEYEPKVTPNS